MRTDPILPPDKIISRLDKGEKGNNLAQEFGIRKQRISDTQRNKVKILNPSSDQARCTLKLKSMKTVQIFFEETASEL